MEDIEDRVRGECVPMTDSSDVRVMLLRESLDAYRREYAELMQVWRNLETKAQGTVAIAGIFVATLFAFLKDVPQGPRGLYIVLLPVSQVLFGFAIYNCADVLKVRKRITPEVGRMVETLALDLAECAGPEIRDRLPDFFRDQSRGWGAALDELREQVQQKANVLSLSQTCVAWGLGCIVLVAVIATVSTVTQLEAHHGEVCQEVVLKECPRRE